VFEHRAVFLGDVIKVWFCFSSSFFFFFASQLDRPKLPLHKINGLGTPHCSKIAETVPLKDALREMFERKEIATAVVNETGKMIACLEPLSLHLLSFDHVPDYNAPVSKFEVTLFY
jgi:hypothetical protein